MGRLLTAAAGPAERGDPVKVVVQPGRRNSIAGFIFLKWMEKRGSRLLGSPFINI